MLENIFCLIPKVIIVPRRCPPIPVFVQHSYLSRINRMDSYSPIETLNWVDENSAQSPIIFIVSPVIAVVVPTRPFLTGSELHWSRLDVSTIDQIPLEKVRGKIVVLFLVNLVKQGLNDSEAKASVFSENAFLVQLTWMQRIVA